MQRDERGRVVSGPMDASTKHAIKRGRLRQLRVDAERAGPPLTEGTKRCSQCGETKRWDVAKRDESEFCIRTRRNKSTGKVLYPAGECKTCTKRRSARHREKLRAEGTLSESQRRWNANRDAEARRAYQRQYGRERRALEGATPRGPWKKYRHELESKVPRVQVAPFIEWFDEWRTATGKPEQDVCRHFEALTGLESGTGQRMLHRFRHTQKMAGLDAIDAFCVAMGMPDQLTVLYPDS